MDAAWEKAKKTLALRLGVDKEIVTYRLLSRLVNVHVNDAKKMLYAFHRDCQPKSHATYIVTGVPKAAAPVANGHDDRSMEVDPPQIDLPQSFTVQKDEQSSVTHEFVQEEELEACKGGFARVISVHVYSVEPCRLLDPSMVLAAAATLRSDAQCLTAWDESDSGAKFGVIQLSGKKSVNGTTKKTPPPSIQLKTESSKPAQAQPSKSTKSSKAKSAPHPKSSSVEASKQTPESGKQLRPGQSRLKRKSPLADDARLESPGPPSSTGKGKAKQVAPDDDDVEMVKANQERRQLEDLMKSEDEPSDAKEKSSSKGKAKGKKESGKPNDGKRRKVRIVKKTFKNAKGYRETRDVEESYSESEAEDVEEKTSKAESSNQKAPPKATATKGFAVPAAAPAKKLAKADKSGQTSLNSFFKKPPK